MTQRVLVDGAAGFLGGHVVSVLLEAGYRVRATDLPQSSLQHPGAEIIRSDLLAPDSLDAVVAGVDIIIHTAALFDLGAPMHRLHAVNVRGTDNLCHAARRHGVRQFIHISSCDVYGSLSVVPATEDHPFRPINRYATSKALAEEVVQRHAHSREIEATILRPSVMYGPGSQYIAGILFSAPAILLGHGLHRIPFFTGGIRFTPVHVEDVARAVVFAAGQRQAGGQIYNVAQPEITTIGAFFQEIFKAMGIQFSLTVPLPTWLVRLIGHVGMALPSRVIDPLVNFSVLSRWRRTQRDFDLNRNFELKFDKQVFSYFLGERAYSSKRLLEAGFRYQYPNEAAGIPPTIKWYVDHGLLPPAPPHAPPAAAAAQRGPSA